MIFWNDHITCILDYIDKNEVLKLRLFYRGKELADDQTLDGKIIHPTYVPLEQGIVNEAKNEEGFIEKFSAGILV